MPVQRVTKDLVPGTCAARSYDEQQDTYYPVACLNTGCVPELAARQGPFGAIVRLLTYTAQRRGEVVRMRWEEIDFKAALWTIPGDRTKNHRAHVVPLTASAMAIIARLPRVGERDFVFPARGYTDRPNSGYSKGKRQLDALADQHNWTLHDLRRTAARCGTRSPVGTLTWSAF